MLEKFFKDLIVRSMGSYIEDFTSDDIQIDNWNGVVTKQSCIMKKSALQSTMRKLIGAPVNVKLGYIRRVKINVPWNELLSKPCEVFIDDIHIVCDSPNHFDIDFMRKFQHKEKMLLFDEMLKQFKEKQEGEEENAESNEQETYLERIKKIIKENLRFTVNNLHLRFEDSNLCREDKSFNLGLIYDQLIYSSTNNRFDRGFINIDDK